MRVYFLIGEYWKRKEINNLNCICKNEGGNRKINHNIGLFSNLRCAALWASLSVTFVSYIILNKSTRDTPLPSLHTPLKIKLPKCPSIHLQNFGENSGTWLCFKLFSEKIHNSKFFQKMKGSEHKQIFTYIKNVSVNYSLYIA